MKCLQISIVVLCLLSAFGAAWAQWTPLSGPYEVRADDISAGRTGGGDDYLFLADVTGYPMRCINGSWMYLTSTIAINHAIIIDCGDDDPLSVCTGMAGFTGVPAQGVWRSADGGNNWYQDWGTPPNNLDNLVMSAVAMDPLNSNHALAGCFAPNVLDDAGYVTTDGGADWYEVVIPGDHVYFITSYTFHPSQGSTAFLTASYPLNQDIAEEIYGELPDVDQPWEGVYQSTDGGANWRQIYAWQPGRPSAYTCMTVHPDYADRYYVGTDQGVLRIMDGGASWSLLPNPPNTTWHGVTGLSFEARSPEPDILWAATQEGVFSTTNDGSTWINQSDGLPGPWNYVRTYEQNPNNSTHLYAWEISTLFEYQPLGYEWSEVGVNLCKAIAMGGCLYRDYWLHVMSWYGSQYGSSESGTSWQTTFSNPFAGGFYLQYPEADVNPDNPQIVFTKFTTNTSASILWRSENGGMGGDWIQVANRASEDRSFVRVANHNPSYVYYAGTGGMGTAQVKRSTDGGLTFEDKPFPTNYILKSFAVDPQNELELYAGLNADPGPQGVYISWDGGDNWTLTQNGLPYNDVKAIAVDPWDASKVLAAVTDGNLYEYDNGSQSWSLYASGLGNVVELVFFPFNGQHVFATVTGDLQGVLYSSDGGQNWDYMPSLAGVYINEGLVVAPAYPMTLYLDTSQGIYKYVFPDDPVVLGNDHWERFVAVSANLLVPEGFQLIVDPGTQVHWSGDYELNVLGIIQSSGTPDRPITWAMATADPEVRWNGIHLNPGASPGCMLQYNQFSTWWDQAIYCDGVTLANSIEYNTFAHDFDDHPGDGIVLRNCGTSMNNNTFSLCDREIYANGCTTFIVSDIDADESRHCIYFENCSDFTVNDYENETTLTTAFYLNNCHNFNLISCSTAGPGSSLEMYNCYHYLIQNCRLNNGSNGVYLLNCTGGTFDTNEILGHSGILGGFYSFNSNPTLKLNDIENNIPHALNCIDRAAPNLFIGIGLDAQNALTTSNSTGYPIYVRSNAFPYLDRGGNDVVNDGETVYRIRDNTSGPPRRFVRNNYWGDPPIPPEYFYPVGNYIYEPYETSPQSPYIQSYEPPTAEEVLWSEATQLEQQGEYALAQEKFYTIIANWPDSAEAAGSVAGLFSCAKGLSGDFAALQSYYEVLAGQASHQELAYFAEGYATHCKTAQEEFGQAIADYDTIIASPPSFTDSICALINRENVLMLEALTGSGTQSIIPGQNSGTEIHRNKINQWVNLLYGSEPTPDAPFDLPTAYVLEAAHPNPFNPATTIRYDLPFESIVKLEVFDVMGRLVTTLVDGKQSAGFRAIRWNGSNNHGAELASGIYFYRLTADATQTYMGKKEHFEKSHKMVMIK